MAGKRQIRTDRSKCSPYLLYKSGAQEWVQQADGGPLAPILWWQRKNTRNTMEIKLLKVWLTGNFLSCNVHTAQKWCSCHLRWSNVATDLSSSRIQHRLPCLRYFVRSFFLGGGNLKYFFAKLYVRFIPSQSLFICELDKMNIQQI